VLADGGLGLPKPYPGSMAATPSPSRARAHLEARSLERKVARHGNVALMRPPSETRRLFEELGPPRPQQRAQPTAPGHERVLRAASWAIVAGWAFAAIALAAFHDHSGMAWVTLSAVAVASIILILPTTPAEKAPQGMQTRPGVPKRASGASRR
jgi:hypothetical protein